MKVLLIFILALTINITVSYCQPFQYQVTLSGNYAPYPITEGQNSELTLTFCNLTSLTLPQNPIPAGGVYILVNFGAGYERTNTVPFNRDDPNDPNDILAASLFTWSQTPGGGWYGISNTSIGSTTILCGKIIMEVLGTGMNINAATTYSAVILSPNSDSSPGDNTGSANLQVNAVMPIELTSFTAFNSDCGEIRLDWETASERNSDYMEVLRSMDGNEFIALGRISGTNTESRLPKSYSFTDNFDLIDRQKYYYRLKQVDFDGRSELFKIVSIENICTETKPTLDIYPNPAFDLVNLKVVGVKEQSQILMHLTNASGELVKTFYVNTKGMNSIDLKGLSGGVYQVMTVESDKNLTGRFIKVD